MRILLIGGNGFIGTPLAKQLQAAKHEVTILHRGQPEREDAKGVGHISGDRNRLSDYRDQLKRIAPDVIVDLILSSGEQAGELMNVARGLTRRVVAISSGDVYRAWGVLHRIETGGLEPLPITEDSPLRSTRRLYSPETIRAMKSIATWATEDYDKIAVEEAVMSSPDVPGTVLRLPMVYGPGDRGHRLFPILEQIAGGNTTAILPQDFAEWRGPRGYVDNVAHAIVLAATDDRAAGRIYNVCEEPCVSELEWRNAVARESGWSGEFTKVPVSETPEHLRFPLNAAQHVVISSQRIRIELGYEEIVPTEEAIRRGIVWERANPPAKS
jgi:nucleoside-diphosphate-sugar epimerase